MSKHEKQNHQKQPEIENQDKTETIEPVKKNDEQLKIEQLNNEIEELKNTVSQKDEHINKLEEEIKAINKDYVTKVTEKANEANAMLKVKIEELTAKTQQELNLHKKYAFEKQANSLIDIVNQFAMALSYKPTDPNILKYQSGFEMFLTMFQNLLHELHIHEIKVNVGDEFNPEVMECIEFVDSIELKDNKVAKIITKGYKLHDRLIKPATVNVVRKKN